MCPSISVIEKADFHPRTKTLVAELMEIIPGLETGDGGDTVVSITEDVGPQFITFKNAERQFVFKLIHFKSRDDLGIAHSIKKEPSQLVLNNFVSSIGLSVADFLMEVFPISLESNQLVNFTVHKDFLFFRMYRFCIREKGPAMEQIGPHLTLRLWRMTEYQGEEKKSYDFRKYVKNLNLL
ncbi:ribosome production factor 1 [Pancytospora philotis]|nr:ribosome production factor 1 [Pancytospora philotis]